MGTKIKYHFFEILFKPENFKMKKISKTGIKTGPINVNFANKNELSKSVEISVSVSNKIQNDVKKIIKMNKIFCKLCLLLTKTRIPNIILRVKTKITAMSNIDIVLASNYSWLKKSR